VSEIRPSFRLGQRIGVFTGDPGARPTNAPTEVPTPSIGFDPDARDLRRRRLFAATTTAAAPAPTSTRRVVRVTPRA